MAGWVKVVEVAGVEEGKAYFIALRPKTPMASYRFWAKGLNGKHLWSEKPGIAVRAAGNDQLRQLLKDRPDCVAVLVPADADTRWRRRKRRF